MAVLSIFGIVRPIGNTAVANPEFVGAYRASVLAIIGVFGYMLTEFGHCSVFQRPKYTTWQEHLFFWLTIAACSALLIYWSVAV